MSSVILSGGGVELELIDFGARVHRLWVNDRGGQRRNIVLGHATAEEHIGSTAFFGATIGRYSNRIAGGRLSIDGVDYALETNDGVNHLHGGADGWHQRSWSLESSGHSEATYSIISRAGEAGFPGEVRASVRYAIGTNDLGNTVVSIEHRATTDAPTVVSMTNHSYFNLDGEDSAHTVDGHLLQVNADRYLPTDAGSIPLGAPAPVEGTPFDLRTPQPIGPVVRANHSQLLLAQGVDHNFCVTGDGLREVAVLSSPASGISLRVATDQPGMQVYTGNFLDGTLLGTGGTRYRQGAGIALEPQSWPDGPNQGYEPSGVLRPGAEYVHRMNWVVGVASTP